MKIAVAGASGFVGRVLVDALCKQHQVLALGRQTQTAETRPGVEWRKVDLFSAGSTVAALKGAEIAIYLVHSMMPSSRLFQGNFHDTDLLLADNFARACSTNGVKQIIYLGGLVPSGHISSHLQSRLEVEGVLQSTGIPVTALRAGMIVGPGGSSFEILRTLVRRLPVMVLPKWTRSKTQAIFLDDIVRVIEAAIGNADFLGRTIDIVNGEALTYRRILEISSEVMGRRRFFLPVPISSTGFSKLWVQIFGNSQYELVSPLIDSLLCDLPSNEPAPEVAKLIRFHRFEEMLRETMARDPGQKSIPQKKRPRKNDTVRSIQRLPSVGRDVHWLAREYMNWLPRFFRALVLVEIRASTGEVDFRIALLRHPLLKLKHFPEEFDLEREKLHIVGGLLSRTTNTGWLEFRQVDHRKYTLVCIHEFVPSLPWPIYLASQAILHSWVMRAFGRHLQELSPESKLPAQ
jgi:uncharacterized protein YbjT (DUF2867 family)